MAYSVNINTDGAKSGAHANTFSRRVKSIVPKIENKIIASTAFFSFILLRKIPVAKKHDVSISEKFKKFSNITQSISLPLLNSAA
ncbi:MAG: hypothetical protein J1F42_10145 [Lachnospiraceae bacterium]|nr:hypothetical protein [Lachnospiraceae bacterium]